MYRAELDKIWAQIRQGAFKIGIFRTEENDLIALGFWSDSRNFSPELRGIIYSE
ncbi:hypothetical protein [Siminovitchia terrae]|uniref:hypothetical protein n=1 Tax=Siminovitchia terrae TaxID=1914933 RepID=UPI001BB42C3B|nr:hypothetical protein [Siminovitchia terrae]